MHAPALLTLVQVWRLRRAPPTARRNLQPRARVAPGLRPPAYIYIFTLEVSSLIMSMLQY